MIKELKIQKTIIFDTSEERKRINKVFKGKQKKRLLNIIELFEQDKLKECEEAYENLPYDEKDHCHEQEYVWGAIANYAYVIPNYRMNKYSKFYLKSDNTKEKESFLSFETVKE
jgi:hypothetical protein